MQAIEWDKYNVILLDLCHKLVIIFSNIRNIFYNLSNGLLPYGRCFHSTIDFSYYEYFLITTEFTGMVVLKTPTSVNQNGKSGS
jgi:hypothetical protein